MIKSVKTIFLIIFCLLTEINSFSQYYVKFKGDSIGFEVDSVILTIDNLHSTINWEVSKDTLTWESLNNNTDSLWVRIDSSAYYRAKLTEGTCAPTYSKVAMVSFRSVYVTGNSVTIEPAGGVYFLASGIKLIVPPGAVKENVTISLDLLDKKNADLKIPIDAYPDNIFCTGIYCEPAETKFLKSIKIILPAINYKRVDIPFVYQYDSTSISWSQNTGPLTCSENEKFIEFSTDTLLSSRIELIKDVFGFSKSSGKSKDDKIDCHELLAQVVTRAHDYSGKLNSGECHAVKEQLIVRFPECPGKPEGKALVQEIGDDCKPLVEDDMAQNIRCLKNGQTATITIAVTIGGIPLVNQEIIFYSIPTGLTMTKTTDKTDNIGTAQFDVKCNVDNFSGTIYYKVNYDYLSELIYASAEGVSDSIKNGEKPGTVFNEHYIDICPYLTTVYLNEINGNNASQLHKGDKRQLTCNCYDQNGNSIDCGKVEYYIVPGMSYPSGSTVSVDASSGLITAVTPGVSYVQAKASGITSTSSYYCSVAYEGGLDLSGITDHNIYQACGCKQDYNSTGQWEWYIVNWKVTLHLSFWLNGIDQTPYGDIQGANSYVYTISNSLCKDTTIYEPVDGFDPEELGKTFSTGTIQEIISGEEFSLDYCWWDYRGWGSLQELILNCTMDIDDPEVINVHVDYFWPHACVLRLNPPDFVLN
jgi:hypothetical protein